MNALSKVALGAPDIYRVPDEMRRTLGQVHMDVCAFVGVAPRGTARVPIEPEACLPGQVFVDPDLPRCRSKAVAVNSWDEYISEFGGFQGPGRLPYAVAAFFEQGGRKAYVVRIVHDYVNAADNATAVAHGSIPNLDAGGVEVRLDARSEGNWGNGLRVALGFSVTPLLHEEHNSTTELLFSPDEPLRVGELLRINLQGGGYELRFIHRLWLDGENSEGDRVSRVILDSPLSDQPATIERVEANLLIDDPDTGGEYFQGLGLSPHHPRALASVLYRESRLVYPHHDWVELDLLPKDLEDYLIDPQRLLSKQSGEYFIDGGDRYQEIVPEDFFDANWVLGNDGPNAGVHALLGLNDLSSVVVADLYDPQPLPELDEETPPVSFAGPYFTPCRPAEPPNPAPVVGYGQLKGLQLNPKDAADYQIILALQLRLLKLAELIREFIVLLDVPPELSQAQVQRWRGRFRSSYVAAYHPWLMISRVDDARDELFMLNPAAVAAGIIARQENTFGVAHGPANVIAQNIVKVAERISPASHDQLHPLGINVYLQQRDGAWLSAGRTLSRDKHYRQLSVRRLMLMLRRALQQQMHWMVFEPNTPGLWAEVRRMLSAYLRQLFIAGAFRGDSEEQAFFVRCDAELNHRRIVDSGQMIAEIGVAPVEPMEFIAVRITRGGDGTLVME
ncbi:MAG: phage tail sheath C-terminal domain-containing protein [Xanthomonadales bacterium]|nr:phage tail sheath C-terminal domain-containing protein [Xanthomonadales bacterium]